MEGGVACLPDGKKERKRKENKKDKRKRGKKRTKNKRKEKERKKEPQVSAAPLNLLWAWLADLNRDLCTGWRGVSERAPNASTGAVFFAKRYFVIRKPERITEVPTNPLIEFAFLYPLYS